MSLTLPRPTTPMPPATLRRAPAPRRDLLLVVGIALTLRLLFLAVTSNTYDYDEFVLLLLARDFAHGAVPYHSFMFFHPPGALVVLRFLAPVTNAWWPAARLFTVAVDGLTAGLVWQIGRRLYDGRTALAAGLLYAVSPLALVSAVRVGQDPLITALGIAGLAILVSTRSQRAALAAGICLGLAIWVKYPAAIFVLAYAFAAGRRTPGVALGLALALLAAFLPFRYEAHALYYQTIVFQRTRWTMLIPQRLETVGLYWLAVNALAIPGLLRRGRPYWLAAGFLSGAVFLLASQVYYHYFVPIVPFGALLAAPIFVRLRLSRVVAGVGALVLTLGWGAAVARGGPSPLYVTAAHLSDVSATVAYLQGNTGPDAGVLGDRFEYAYLAQRRVPLHYFWNVGVLVDAGFLEKRLSRVEAVVLSHGASSGYPDGFTSYLGRHYPHVDTGATTVWLIRPEKGKNGRGERI